MPGLHRRIKSNEDLAVLYDLFLDSGIPAHIRSVNGAEFTAGAVRNGHDRIVVQTIFIEPGSPWENDYCESFNGALREELLNGEIFYTLKETQIQIDNWRKEYNQFRPHSSLGYKPPAPVTIAPQSNAIEESIETMMTI